MKDEQRGLEYTIEGEHNDWRYYKTGIQVDFFTGKRTNDEKARFYWVMNDGRTCHYSFNTVKIGDRSTTYMFIDADNCEPNLVVVAEDGCPMIPELDKIGVKIDGHIVDNGVRKSVYFMERIRWFKIGNHWPPPWLYSKKEDGRV